MGLPWELDSTIEKISAERSWPLSIARSSIISRKCGDEVFAYYNHPGKTGEREHVGYVPSTVLTLFNIKVHSFEPEPMCQYQTHHKVNYSYLDISHHSLGM